MVAGGYLLYLDDGTGLYNAGMQPFQLNQVISDGKMHELKVDLRRVQTSGGGVVRGMALAVYSGNVVPATFDLLSLRFEAAGADKSASQPSHEDQRVTVLVSSGKNNTRVAGAAVVVDGERRNYARRAITDASGLANVMALSNASGGHVARVTKEGMGAGAGEANTPIGGSFVVPISLSPAASYSGRVIDEAGKPVNGALVRLWTDLDTNRQDDEPPSELAIADSDGRWQIAAPASARNVTLMAIAPRYGPALLEIDATANSKPLEVRLTKPHTIHIRVVDDEGKPITGVQVACHFWRDLPVLSWSATTDQHGRVAWTYAPEEPIMFDIFKQGYSAVRGVSLAPGKQEHVLTLTSNSESAQ
jgi:hypothetical protein